MEANAAAPNPSLTGSEGATPSAASSDWLSPYPPARSLLLDQEALQIFAAAYRIGVKRTSSDVEPPVSFSTLMLGLLGGQDETSTWFRAQAETCGPRRSKVLEHLEVNEGQLEGSWEPTPPSGTLRLSADQQLLTSSARTVLLNAEAWAQHVGGTDIGVRHLVAAFVVNPPPNHRNDLKKWEVRESEWRARFFDFCAKNYRWEAWVDASKRAAPTRGMDSFGRQELNASELDWSGDDESKKLLERAAAEHARRNDPWLGLRTLLFALGDVTLEDAQMREKMAPFAAAVRSKRDTYDQRKAAYFAERVGTKGVRPFAELRISPRVLNVLETARELAHAGHSSRRQAPASSAGALHLAAAVFSTRVDADKELLELGFDVAATRRAFVEEATKRGESREVWSEVLTNDGSLFEARSVELNSDEPDAVIRGDEEWKHDPLVIRPDVGAFAALLSSKTLKPPISIGLFGPWGSGKTTFLKRLQRTIEERARKAREASSKNPAAPSECVGHVVHVEFNAWHFGEGALVSSLVDTIFRRIDAYLKDETDATGRSWLEQKTNDFETTKRNVEAAEALKATAKESVTRAETALQEQRAKAEQGTVSVKSALAAVLDAAKTSIASSDAVTESKLLEAVGSTVASKEELEARLDQVRARPARLLLALGWPRTLLFAALVLLVPPGVAWLVQTIFKGPGVESVTALLATTAATVGFWLKSASKGVAGLDGAIAKLTDEFERRVATDPNVRQARDELAQATAKLETAAVNLSKAREELARAESEAANASLPAQMLRVIERRTQSLDYRKELTTLSLARADLEQLSRILMHQDGESTTSKERAGASPQRQNLPAAPRRPVQRVVLYIDDLDRCQPEDVVRVLQLVHMLLAFELFAVIVAVDARWIEQSLRYSYTWLRDSHDDGAHSGEKTDAQLPASRKGALPESHLSPRDYLEKIFQITFWLEPMTGDRAARYLATLTRDRPATSEPATSKGSLEISSLELDFMRALAAHVGPSPRRVKRLVNSYRMIKARLMPDQLANFTTLRDEPRAVPRSGPYQIVVGLLVIGCGAPTHGSDILKLLTTWDPSDRIASLIEHLKARKLPEFEMAAQVLQTLAQSQDLETVSPIRGWARHVDRFQLHRANAPN